MGRIALSCLAPSFHKTCLIVIQEDPDGEHQENVLATGMVANSRPRDNMTKTTRTSGRTAIEIWGEMQGRERQVSSHRKNHPEDRFEHMCFKFEPMWLKCYVCLLAMPDLRRHREGMCEPG